MVLYEMAREVPYRRLEDVSCRRYEDFPIHSNLLTPRDVSSRRLDDVPQRHPVDVTSLYGSISKAKKRPRDKDFCIWSYHQ